MLDNIDYFLRLNRESAEPFGGVQMVFFGDLFQLPPVLKREEKAHFDFIYDSPYFFSAKVLEKEYPLEYIELSRVFRQEQKHLITVSSERSEIYRDPNTYIQVLMKPLDKNNQNTYCFR